jgi:hypothetical protein
MSIAALVQTESGTITVRFMTENANRQGKVTSENREEAARLKAIWGKTYEERKLSGVHTQAAFGTTFGIGNQAAVGFFLNGTTALSKKAARGFAKGLKCSIADFSPRLAAEIDALAGQLDEREDSDPVVPEALSESAVVEGLADFLAKMPVERHQEFLAFVGALVHSRGSSVHSRAALTALLGMQDQATITAPAAPEPAMPPLHFGEQPASGAVDAVQLLNQQQRAELAAAVSTYMAEGGASGVVAPESAPTNLAFEKALRNKKLGKDTHKSEKPARRKTGG